MSSASGSGPGQVSAVFAPNDGPQRSGQIRIADQTIAVTQASRCTWALSPTVLDYDAGGGHGAVLVLITGGCAWTATVTVNWITMQSGTSGTGEGVVQFVVAENPGASRSAIVRIGGMDVLVRQGAR
jgi:hypothetical protein